MRSRAFHEWTPPSVRFIARISRGCKICCAGRPARFLRHCFNGQFLLLISEL